MSRAINQRVEVILSIITLRAKCFSSLEDEKKVKIRKKNGREKKEETKGTFLSPLRFFFFPRLGIPLLWQEEHRETVWNINHAL